MCILLDIYILECSSVCDNNIKINHKEIRWECVNWLLLSQMVSQLDPSVSNDLSIGSFSLK